VEQQDEEHCIEVSPKSKLVTPKFNLTQLNDDQDTVNLDEEATLTAGYLNWLFIDLVGIFPVPQLFKPVWMSKVS